MDIQLDYKAAKDLILLKALSNHFVYEGEQLSAAGVMTESGEFKYIEDQYIKNYYLQNRESPLAYESQNESLVLNETQLSIDPATLPDSYDVPDTSYAIQLTPIEWLNSQQIETAKLDEFNAKQECIHVVFEFELDSQANNKACLSSEQYDMTLPLNDLLDLCIKSRFKKTLKNSNVPFNLNQPADDRASYNSNVDQWLALDKYPIDFCECNGDSYMLTQPVEDQPYKLESSLKDQILNNELQVEHTFSYVKHPVKTYLYRSHEKLDASSYQEYLLSGGSKLTTQEGLVSLFTPDITVKNIKYNYIMSIDQCSNSNAMYDNKTVYENGDIYGSFGLAKNMYNALYSVDMPEQSVMKNCRRYCGIHNSANSIVLKYYDDTDYKISLSSGDDNASAESMKTESKVPYQKVEIYQPQQMTAASRHKSNLFSVRIFNTNLDDAFAANKGTEYQYVAENVKKDIMNGVRALAESIAPANTQLFTTYFQ